MSPTQASSPATATPSAGSTSPNRFDLVVIGAGPGGYVAAIRAGQLGLRTAIVERDRIGGICLNYGCIPSKSLIYASGLFEKIQHADALGFLVDKPKVDGARLQAWKAGIVKRLTTGVGFLLSKNNVTVLMGSAKFTGPHAMTVTSGDGKAQTVEFAKCIVATGARPVALPAFPVDGKVVVTSKEALDIATVPNDLVVIGGGVIGLEMGMVFLKLGSRLTIVELTDSLLPGTDPEAVKLLERSLAKRGATILKSTKAGGLVTEKGKTYVTAVGSDGAQHKLPADVVLVAVGFKPNSDGMGLDAAGVKTDSRGNIPVDEHRRTIVPHVYAIGDVAGQPWLAHKASKEGLVAAEHAAGKPAAYDVKAMPAGIFTDPEIGTVGLQEHEAAKAGKKVRIGKFPFTALGKALAISQTDGFVKLIADAENDLLLGATIVGYGAADLTAEIALAIEMGATAEDVGLTVHAHPTMPESLMEAAEAVHKQAIHILNA
jgi:dihydrolipoamide dehydrogenase